MCFLGTKVQPFSETRLMLFGYLIIKQCVLLLMMSAVNGINSKPLYEGGGQVFCLHKDRKFKWVIKTDTHIKKIRHSENRGFPSSPECKYEAAGWTLQLRRNQEVVFLTCGGSVWFLSGNIPVVTT